MELLLKQIFKKYVMYVHILCMYYHKSDTKFYLYYFEYLYM